jgi:pyruvate dehydrogenase E2 component (dihydrolipoamide acetyltransferase)
MGRLAMPTPFIMPKFDMDQETATVIEWLKKEGDFVKYDEDVLVVETDKVAIEVPSPAEGILTMVLAKVGDVVPVAEVIAYILAEGETEADVIAGKGTTSAEELPEQSEVESDLSPGNSLPATPVAARMARELDLNIAQVIPAGDRVTKADIERYLAQDSDLTGSLPETIPPRVSVPATPAARRLARELNVDLASVVGSGPRNRVQALDVRANAEKTPARLREAQQVALSGIKRTISERMQASFFTAPHIALSVEVDISQLEETRRQMNDLADTATTSRTDSPGGGNRISLTALLVRSVAYSLARHPYLNASLDEEIIYLWKEINIGVAIAIDGGLVVPVIHGANQLSVSQINGRLREMSGRARDGGLTMTDVHNGTFTLSNLGMFGIDHFRAIINPPESAILAVGQAVRKPVVINSQDDIGVRSMMMLTLSADHRLVDGVTAAKFLADLVRAIESPDLMLL